MARRDIIVIIMLAAANNMTARNIKLDALSYERLLTPILYDNVQFYIFAGVYVIGHGVQISGLNPA